MLKDRFDAAYQLAPLLKEYTALPDTIILAIPRGGIELGFVLAKELKLPLDVIFIKKIGYPGNPEYAIGAVSATHVFIDKKFEQVGLDDYIAHEVESIREMLYGRSLKYRGDKPPLNVHNKTVIVVDDGVATGSTVIAALELIKQDKPKKIIVALPVGSAQTLETIKSMVDEVVCLQIPSPFFSVGQAYIRFDQVDDQEAIRLLHEANS